MGGQESMTPEHVAEKSSAAGCRYRRSQSATHTSCAGRNTVFE